MRTRQDAGYFMSRDRINDLIVEPIINFVDQNAILACQDRYVRVLDVNKLHYESFVQVGFRFSQLASLRSEVSHLAPLRVVRAGRVQG